MVRSTHLQRVQYLPCHQNLLFDSVREEENHQNEGDQWLDFIFINNSAFECRAQRIKSFHNANSPCAGGRHRYYSSIPIISSFLVVL